MYPRGRPIVPDFEPAELLFLRYGAEHWVEGQLHQTAVKFPSKSGVSVNRSGPSGALSEPEDVLFDEHGKYNGLGVVGFAVSAIPPRLDPDHDLKETWPSFVFFPRHVPLDAENDPNETEINYAHSEIWSQRADSPRMPGQYKEPSPTAKLRFRIQLCKIIRQEQICVKAVR